MTTTGLPGRDRRAVLHRAPPGRAQIENQQSVIVVGGGIAGLAAATGLAEAGVRVSLLEATPRLGGRVAAWPLPGTTRTMSRGFHAFFRQYYNLRALLARIDPTLGFLRPIDDYPLQRPDGMRDTFTSLARTPPWSMLHFVARSPAFSLAGLARVNLPAALELLRVRFPDTYSNYDGQSAEQFLQRLHFPAAARDLALEVFARSFFADPTEFAAGELVAMFHTYFLGSAEGLLFEVPEDDYDTTLWAPLGSYLASRGVQIQVDCPVHHLELSTTGASVHTPSGQLSADAVVLATDPRQARALCAALPDAGLAPWQRAVAATRNAPPFVVVRLWLDRHVEPGRAAFLGTAGYGPLDNVSVLERFERGAATWSAKHRGSVVELHAYACTQDSTAVVGQLLEQLHRVYPETCSAQVVHQEVLLRDDCTLIDPKPWAARPGVSTPAPHLVVAGDWVRCDYPVALMERAATTGFLAANTLLQRWSTAGHDLWSVPMRGLLARR